MSSKDIIVSRKSFESDNPHDIISSNSQYITKLFQNKISEDNILEDALKSYYIDYYHSHIQHGGYLDFIKYFEKKPKILYYIAAGLETLKSQQHLTLFKKVFFEDEPYLEKNKLDDKFKEIQKHENLLSLNHKWLMNHPQLTIMDCNDINKNIEKYLETDKEDKRHIKIIKQLCQMINEEFIAVTAGDNNNIYNRSWHFKTTQNYYYMIEKDNIVTMYNSFTKQEVTKAKLVLDKTDKSIISDFIYQMLA